MVFCLETMCRIVNKQSNHIFTIPIDQIKFAVKYKNVYDIFVVHKKLVIFITCLTGRSRQQQCINITEQGKRCNMSYHPTAKI